MDRILDRMGVASFRTHLMRGVRKLELELCVGARSDGMRILYLLLSLSSDLNVAEYWKIIGQVKTVELAAVLEAEAMWESRRRYLSPGRQGAERDYIYYDPYRRCIDTGEQTLQDVRILLLYATWRHRKYAVVPEDVSVLIAHATRLSGLRQRTPLLGRRVSTPIAAGNGLLIAAC